MCRSACLSEVSNSSFQPLRKEEKSEKPKSIIVLLDRKYRNREISFIPLQIKYSDEATALKNVVLRKPCDLQPLSSIYTASILLLCVDESFDH